MQRALILLAVVLSATNGPGSSPGLAGVDLVLRPLQTTVAGSSCTIGLMASSSGSNADMELVAGLEVVLAWEPTQLGRIGPDTPVSLFAGGISEFPNGSLYPVNDSLADGDAFYSGAIALEAVPICIGQEGVVIAQFEFPCLSAVPTTVVRILPGLGEYAKTVVWNEWGDDICGSLGACEFAIYPVPEPGSVVLVSAGLLALASAAARKRSRL